MSDFQTPTAAARGGAKFKHIALLLLIAFAVGGVAAPPAPVARPGPGRER